MENIKIYQMNNIKIIALSFFVLATVVVGSGLTRGTTSCQETEDILKQENNQNQTINLFVTHGHCSTPFAGNVENLKVVTTERQDQGNPLEDMEISFEIDPNSFNVCASDDLTARIKTPGLFIGENDEKITFKSKEVYTVGLDWYQVNGQLSIKGVVKEMKILRPPVCL